VLDMVNSSDSEESSEEPLVEADKRQPDVAYAMTRIYRDVMDALDRKGTRIENTVNGYLIHYSIGEVKWLAEIHNTERNRTMYIVRDSDQADRHAYFRNGVLGNVYNFENSPERQLRERLLNAAVRTESTVLERTMEDAFNTGQNSSLDREGTLDRLMRRSHLEFQERMRSASLQEVTIAGLLNAGSELYDERAREISSNEGNAENNNRLLRSDGSQGSSVDSRALESPGNGIQDADSEDWDDMEGNEEEDL
jgi:hypothetical protein